MQLQNLNPKAVVTLVIWIICLLLAAGLAQEAGAITVQPPEEVAPSPPPAKATPAKPKPKPRKKPAPRPEPEEEAPIVKPATPAPAVPAPPPPPSRFTKTSAGIIQDSQTGLEWYVGPDRNTSWNEAQTWCQGLTGGSDWRLPSLAELKGIYLEGTRTFLKLDSLFTTTGVWVWSREIRNASSAWGFIFDRGKVDWGSIDCSNYPTRAFAVRSRR